jgi:predicted amidophosphoribosyltransferase
MYTCAVCGAEVADDMVLCSECSDEPEEPEEPLYDMDGGYYYGSR